MLYIRQTGLHISTLSERELTHSTFLTEGLYEGVIECDTEREKGGKEGEGVVAAVGGVGGGLFSSFSEATIVFVRNLLLPFLLGLPKGGAEGACRRRGASP